jgi:hypothetical protein
MLERGGQPPLDMQQHPAAVGDRLDRFSHEVPRHLVEELLDVEIDHPVVLPAPLLACRERIVGRLGRPVPIGVRVEPMVRPLLRCMATTVCATLSAIVGTPSIRTPRAVRLGDLHPLTGSGK